MISRGSFGAFAITSDVIIILLGLAIGALEFAYLEHGAHYAIGILAIIMSASVQYHIPEWFTGLSGVAFILVSLWLSLRYNKGQLAIDSA